MANYSDYLIIDSQNAVGGRVQTEIVEGYELDRGCQVFIDAYPESKQVFNYKALELRRFIPGALIRYKSSFHLLSDPLKQPQKAWQVVKSPIGSFADKLKVILSLLLKILLKTVIVVIRDVVGGRARRKALVWSQHHSG